MSYLAAMWTSVTFSNYLSASFKIEISLWSLIRQFVMQVINIEFCLVRLWVVSFKCSMTSTHFIFNFLCPTTSSRLIQNLGSFSMFLKDVFRFRIDKRSFVVRQRRILSKMWRKPVWVIRSISTYCLHNMVKHSEWLLQQVKIDK